MYRFCQVRVAMLAGLSVLNAGYGANAPWVVSEHPSEEEEDTGQQVDFIIVEEEEEEANDPEVDGMDFYKALEKDDQTFNTLFSMVALMRGSADQMEKILGTSLTSQRAVDVSSVQVAQGLPEEQLQKMEQLMETACSKLKEMRAIEKSLEEQPHQEEGPQRNLVKQVQNLLARQKSLEEKVEALETQLSAKEDQVAECEQQILQLKSELSKYKKNITEIDESLAKNKEEYTRNAYKVFVRPPSDEEEEL